MHTLKTSLLGGGLLLTIGLGLTMAQNPVASPTPAASESKPAVTDEAGSEIDAVPKTITPPPAQGGYPDIGSLPPPAPASTPSGYPDIESLRKPGSSAALFPVQPTPTPVPGAYPGYAGYGQSQLGTTLGGRRAGGGVLGHKRNSGRQRDVLVDLADSDPLQVRVAYRHAKTVAMANAPQLANLLKEADAAGTDVQKRAFLKQYYTLLYAEIVKADPSPEMKKHVDTLQLITQSRYDPRRREVGGDEDITMGRGGGRRGGGRNR